MVAIVLLALLIKGTGAIAVVVVMQVGHHIRVLALRRRDRLAAD